MNMEKQVAALALLFTAASMTLGNLNNAKCGFCT